MVVIEISEGLRHKLVGYAKRKINACQAILNEPKYSPQIRDRAGKALNFWKDLLSVFEQVKETPPGLEPGKIEQRIRNLELWKEQTQIVLDKLRRKLESQSSLR